MADYTISSFAPTLTFDNTTTGAIDVKIRADQDDMAFKVGNAGWPSAMIFDDAKVRFQRSLDVLSSSGTGVLKLEGASDWRLRATTKVLDFDVYYNSAWRTVFALQHKTVSPNNVFLANDLSLARNGTVEIDQAASSEDLIARFEKSSGGSAIDVNVSIDGWLVCTPDLGVRTKFTTSAPSGGSVGDVVVYSDVATGTSHLMVRTTAGGGTWRGLELDLS
jgi:hypothetical protein